MRDTVINQFNVGNEIQELYWIVGTQFNEESSCFLRPVLRGVESGQFHMCYQPIGMLPILTLGQHYYEGRLLRLSQRGEPMTCVLSDVGDCEEITSAEIPESLYSFDNRTTGTQRLFKYKVDDLEILIPTTELIRYLFAHNRTLANAMMRDMGLMTLFRAVKPDFYEELQIDFTEDMPLKAISNKFAEEFSWLAVDTEARKSWDSIFAMSYGQDYLSFTPPSIRNSKCEFRVVRHGNQVLVLEIMLMSGKVQPCKKLIFTHPSMKQVIKIGSNKNIDLNVPGSEGTEPEGESEKYEYEHKLEANGLGSTANLNPRILHNGLKRMSFESRIKIERQFNIENRESTNREPVSAGTKTKSQSIKKIINVSAGDISGFAELPPVEFSLLTPEMDADIGDLECVADVIESMAALVPDRRFSLSYCRLKPGKTFSTNGRAPRLAAIGIVEADTYPPICILDVDHSGGYALSLLAVTFKQQLPMIEVELIIQKILDGLVDNNGHWSNAVETELEQSTHIDRFPKLISPRDEGAESGKTIHRVIKLASKLQLFKTD